ncbi:MAG: hypothetical protein ABSA21_11980 [Candidatus Limnocylindrales bacterium]
MTDWRRFIAFVTYAILATISVGAAMVLGRTWAAAIMLTIPVLLLTRQRPILFGATLVAGGILLRLSFSFSGVYTDGIEAAQLAAGQLLNGSNPYGHVLAGASQSNTIYPYGPLALLAYIPGYWTEIVAAAGLLILLARERAWLTLAFTSAFPVLVRATVDGQNDILPCLLILLAVLQLRGLQAPVGGYWRARWTVSAIDRSSLGPAVRAALLLAIAIAIKPYAAAWAPGLIGFAGAWAAAALIVLSLVLWSPVLLVWTPAAFIESERMQLTHHPDTGIALNLPILQLLAAPLSVLGFFVRSWQAMYWLGLAIFLVFLYFSPWASWGYLEGIAPSAMLMVELWLVAHRTAGTEPADVRSRLSSPQGRPMAERLPTDG